jgi:hypothetical protein
VSRVSAEEARGLLKALNAAEVPYGDGWKFTEAGFIHTRGNVAIGECWSQPVAALAAAAPTLARTVIALTEERDALAQRVASLDRAMADANESRKWDMVAAQSRQTAQENAERARAAAEVRADRLAAERDQLAAELADANDELARCSLATYGHDADSHCLSESIAEVVRERDEARAALEALPKWGDYGWRDAAASVAAKLREDASQIAALMSERDEARRERDRHATALYAAGFTPCDSAACNCGGWHGGHAEGLRVRLRHVAQMLIAAVGAGGPMDAEAAAEKAVAAVMERDRLRDVLDAETGKRGPEGWAWTPHDTWSRYSTGAPGASATVWRHADQAGVEWSWRVNRDLRGTAPTALDAIEAADRAAKETPE